MVGAFGGSMIDISGSSAVRINALDMEKGYADDGKDPLPDKSEFVLSLFEQIMQDDLKAQPRSIIDRCVQAVYRPYIASGYKGNAPTLTDLQAEIKKQPEPEAQELALAAELFISGSLSIFAQKTNVDQNNRLTSYNILDLGEQLLPMGMLVILGEHLQPRYPKLAFWQTHMGLCGRVLYLLPVSVCNEFLPQNVEAGS